MTRVAEHGKFSLEAGILRVERELDEIEAEELAAAVGQLVRSGVAAPVVDLGEVSFLPSYHVSGIQEAASDCRRDGRSLTVIGSRGVIMMLERMGLGSVARLKAID
jgi:anti-anti-sigma regulatory factor